jgi:opacity protein-like surface antigen
MSKTFLLIYVLSATAAAQPITFGIKGGVPLQDAFNIKSPSSITQFTIGPMVELHLPLGLGVEADVLYNRYNLRFSDFVASITSGSYSSSVDIPILLKYRVGGAPLIHPYVEGGPAFRKLFNVPSNFSGVSFKTTGKGFALGAGVELRLLLLRISPEIRYTHWGSQTFSFPGTTINSAESQTQFLVGLSW